MAPAPSDEVAPAAVADRVCGRCRKSFEGDPDAHPTAQQGWWACAGCREALSGPVLRRDRP